MEKHTLEAISITALVISVFVLIVLVFKMVIKHLYANGKINKMNGGDGISENVNAIKAAIHNISVAYSPGSDEYNDAITNFASTRNMELTLYAIFSLSLIDRCSPEELAVSYSLLDVCRNNLNMNDSLISRTIDMLENQRSIRPIPIREIRALNDEWLQHFQRSSDASARPVPLN